MAEYAVALLLLVVALIPVMALLGSSANERANESLQTVKKVAPCTDRLAQLSVTPSGGVPVAVNLGDPEVESQVCN